jgi:D-tyrosyl-tRNA(Tyr) deacylase
VLQRTARASVVVDGSEIGSIGRGLLVLVGFAPGDTDVELEWMADKIVGLRVFPDDDGRMNRDLRDVDGALLVVSQFTLYGDVRRGRRPSFVDAAPPAEAEANYDRFVAALASRGVRVATGAFGASMRLELVNDGPVTLVLDRCSS